MNHSKYLSRKKYDARQFMIWLFYKNQEKIRLRPNIHTNFTFQNTPRPSLVIGTATVDITTYHRRYRHHSKQQKTTIMQNDKLLNRKKTTKSLLTRNELIALVRVVVVCAIALVHV